MFTIKVAKQYDNFDDLIFKDNCRKSLSDIGRAYKKETSLQTAKQKAKGKDIFTEKDYLKIGIAFLAKELHISKRSLWRFIRFHRDPMNDKSSTDLILFFFPANSTVRIIRAIERYRSVIRDEVKSNVSLTEKKLGRSFGIKYQTCALQDDILKSAKAKENSTKRKILNNIKEELYEKEHKQG